MWMHDGVALQLKERTKEDVFVAPGFLVLALFSF